MNTQLFALVLIMSLFLSCEKDTPETNDSLSVEDQEWYKQLAVPCDDNTICQLKIIEALYNNDTVYYSIYSGALCDMIFSVVLVDVLGAEVKRYGYNDFDTFTQEVSFIATVFDCA